MKFSRLTVAASLSAALVLSSCSGSDEPSEGTAAAPPTTSDEAATGTADPADGASETAATTTDDADTTSDAAPATGGAEDDSSSTSAPGDEASVTEMTDDETAADLDVATAEEVAAEVLSARQTSLRASQGSWFRQGRDGSMAGSAETASTAAFTLRDVLGPSPEAESKEAAEPNVLAISRADDDPSAFLLVQTVPDSDGVPILHLMASESGEEADFRIVWEAPMLPGTTVPTFDRRSVGTPVMLKGSGKGELLEEPRATLKSLASYISWPQPEETPDYRTHGYSPAVRRAAEAQADAVASQATLREKNWLISDDTRTLVFEDGSALILGTLLRDTTFTVNQGSVLTPPEAFTALADDDSITEEAVMRTMVFVAMRVPHQDNEFKPEMLAAREQLVEAWGS